MKCHPNLMILAMLTRSSEKLDSFLVTVHMARNSDERPTTCDLAHNHVASLRMMEDLESHFGLQIVVELWESHQVITMESHNYRGEENSSKELGIGLHIQPYLA